MLLTTAEFEPLSIRISPRDGGRYKSITTLAWDDIPGFALLTGKNGSGKTQLLEILTYHFSGARPSPLQFGAALPVSIEVIGRGYTPDEIGYVSAIGMYWGASSISLGQLPQMKGNALQHIRNFQSNAHDVVGTVRAHRLMKRLGGPEAMHLPPEELMQRLPDHFEFALDDHDACSGLVQVFIAHRMKVLWALDRGTPGVDIDGKAIGPAPWDVLNEVLARADFTYSVISPVRTHPIDSYTLLFTNRDGSVTIDAGSLSSGEKVLLQLVFWLFTANKEGVFPKFLLLDEPDAHLHPSMTTQFLDVISDVLVGKYGVRVILSTHSPSTVALAPPGSVFALERGGDRVVRVENRANILSVLTAGLVTVSPATRFCFVEDQSDVDFYDVVREILMDSGPSRHAHALKPSPSIVFMPASIGEGAGKVGGGASRVRQFVAKFDAPPLNQTFCGITDRDAGNTPSDRLFVHGRYSIENYLVDPLILYTLLSEEGTAPAVRGVSITRGDEHLIRNLDQAQLQAVVTAITDLMQAREPRLANAEPVSVRYGAALEVHVPDWVIDLRGHDLLPIAQAAFGGPRLVTPPRLLKALRHCRVLPLEMAELLAAVQTAG